MLPKAAPPDGSGAPHLTLIHGFGLIVSKGQTNGLGAARATTCVLSRETMHVGTTATDLYSLGGKSFMDITSLVSRTSPLPITGTIA